MKSSPPAASVAGLFILLSACAFAQAPAQTQNVSGKWTGTFEISAPDGSVQHDTAVLILKQDGNSITGSAGANEAQQSEIKSGNAAGPDIQFAIEVHGAPMIFHLHLEGGHLKGDATGEMPGQKISAKVDVVASGSQVTKAPPEAQALFNEISRMDAVLFEAFNKRDLDKLKTLFTTDLEFYHDREGLTHYDENMDSFKRHFAEPTSVRRELAAGTLEVYPIGGYGAAEIGIHRFYSADPGQKEKLTATAKFLVIWQKQSKDGEWKVSRVVSYDHH